MLLHVLWLPIISTSAMTLRAICTIPSRGLPTRKRVFIAGGDEIVHPSLSQVVCPLPHVVPMPAGHVVGPPLGAPLVLRDTQDMQRGRRTLGERCVRRPHGQRRGTVARPGLEGDGSQDRVIYGDSSSLHSAAIRQNGGHLRPFGFRGHCRPAPAPHSFPPINNKSAPRPPSGAGDGTCALSASASIVRRGQARHKSVRRCTRTIGGGIVRQH
jgi:hypothetical protein